MTNAIDIQDAKICYGSQVAVQSASLSVAPGELHVLLGRSGSGKTTLLRAIAGFESLTSGTIDLHGEAVDEGRGRPLAPERRGVGVVFQDYALFPHLSVGENLRFGAPALKRDEVEAQLGRVGLGGYAARATSALSGGEQQRVALARALAAKPRILLLDEPFSNLDRQLRHDLRQRTLDVLRQAKIAAVFVTHDALEAFSLGDRLSVMHQGKLLQSGTAQEIYDTPKTRAVAQSVGEALFLPATVSGQYANCALGAVPLRSGADQGDTLMIRPEQISLVPVPEGLALGEALIKNRVYQGAQTRLTVLYGEVTLHAIVPTQDLPQGQQVRLWLARPCVMV